MLVIPAIDIKNGKCVRLYQGSYENVTVYNDNPVTVAKQWENEGAKLLHLVDLDGAKNGTLENIIVVKNIVKAVSIPIQIGGGIRDKNNVELLLAAGISRVVLGTLALENKTLLKELLRDYSQSIAVALDTKNGRLMQQGWLTDSGMDTVTTARELEAIGVERFIYTDVIKDGTLTQPNYTEISRLLKNISVPVIVSGGISDIVSITKLKTIGLEGVIIGKALYEEKITLQEAISAS